MRHTSYSHDTKKILESLGLTPEQQRLLRARLLLQYPPVPKRRKRRKRPLLRLAKWYVARDVRKLGERIGEAIADAGKADS
jgi:hypothetical protein